MSAPHSKVGDVVQCNPERFRWGPALVVVTKVHKWGVTGYFNPPVPAHTVDSIAYVRVNWEDCVHVGPARWFVVELDGVTGQTDRAVSPPDP